MKFIKDPTTRKQSVSLTILVIAVCLMTMFIILEAFDTLQSSTLLDTFWYSAVGLYFGRRADFLRKKD